jgi:hypothetical protein
MVGNPGFEQEAEVETIIARHRPRARSIRPDAKVEMGAIEPSARDFGLGG